MAGRKSAASKRPASLQALRREVAEGWPPGLTLLSGDDLFHLDAAQKALLATLVPATDSEYALTVFGGESVDVGIVVAAARSAAMFAPRRVVLVRDASALSGEPDSLVEYAARPPAESYLIVRATSLDLRLKLHKALAGEGRWLEFSNPRYPDPRRTEAEIDALARERGLDLRRDALALLAEIAAGDLYAAQSELDKLAALLARSKDRRVSAELVRRLAAGDQSPSGWEVADAIAARDRAAAVAAVARLLDAGDEPLRIVGGVAWRARLMLQGKALLERGLAPPRVAKALGRPPRDLMDSLQRYSLPELLAFPHHLLQADRALKGSTLSPRAVLETMVERMTAEAGGTERR